MASVKPGPPGPDISQAPLLIGVTTALHIISLTLYGARIWTRVRPTVRLGLDDYFITAAVLIDLLVWAFLLVGIYHGVGRHNYYVPPDEMILAEKYLFLSQPPYAWSLAFSKLSIAWMLNRIWRDDRVWAWLMKAVMLLVVGTAITMNIFQLSICKPLWAVWDHSNPDAVCMDLHVAQISIYVTAAMTILTDIILSLAPITFIVNIQRPLRERLVLTFVMGLGIFASIASILKTFKVKDYGVTGDDLMDTVGLTTWSMVEMQLAIIASCIPTLKSLLETFLRRFGLVSSYNSTNNRSKYIKQNDSTQHQHQLSTLRSKHGDKGSSTHDGTESFQDLEGEQELSTMPASAGNPVYFRTAIRSNGARRQEEEEARSTSQEHILANAGIQKETTFSVRVSPQ